MPAEGILKNRGRIAAACKDCALGDQDKEIVRDIFQLWILEESYPGQLGNDQKRRIIEEKVVKYPGCDRKGIFSAMAIINTG